METVNYQRQRYDNTHAPSWCKGCSFYNVRKSIGDALFRLQRNPLETVIVSGIGCSSRLPLFSGTFGMHTLHGRAIPVATGVHYANPKLTVLAVGGDGDLFSIGAGHFMHAARSNVNITVLCLDNRMYAMTKNQSSPTSPIGHTGSLTPSGNAVQPLNCIELAISCKATFVAGTAASSQDHMTSMIEQALTHQGFSFIHIAAPCKTFDLAAYNDLKKTPIYDIGQNPTYDIHNYNAAICNASQLENPESGVIKTGVFYKK